MKNYKWQNLTVVELEKKLNTSASKGLTEGAYLQRLKLYGHNTITSQSNHTYFRIALNQFKSSLVLLLLCASLISLLMGEWVDAMVILSAVALNAIMGFIQEFKAEQALQTLHSMVKHISYVRRADKELEVESSILVPGDVVILRAGDKVPADGRIIESYGLEVNEAVLTGESAPMNKTAVVLKADRDKQSTYDNMAYMGSVVSKGRGVILVVATGANTHFGQIADLLATTQETETPLQIQLHQFSKQFSRLAVVIIVLIVGLSLGKGFVFTNIFMTAVAIAVAAIPEGMLIAVTVILAIGMQHILKKGSIVRKLVAVETLGSVTVICTDKTGTLTQGTMQLSSVVTRSSVADMASKSDKVKIVQKADSEHILALKIGFMCNDAIIENPEEVSSKWVMHGSYTEKALLWSAMYAGFNVNQIRGQEIRIGELPFSSETKFMATMHKRGNQQVVYVKGATDVILQKSQFVFIGNTVKRMTATDRHFFLEQKQILSNGGFRVLAVAYNIVTGDIVLTNENITNLVFVGLMVLKDPLREEAYETIRLAQEAGIKTIMITGDDLLTARAIAREVGIVAEDNNVLEGGQLDAMSDEEFSAIISQINVYARVLPKHKSRIVDIWQQKGEVVAMTGDGVNDAPALKKSDIGIAFGSGTEVAKETADIVLLDNNFKTIVAAIEQGRVIFENIRKVMLYLVSDSFSEVIVVAGSLLLGLAVPITTPQILWINLINDGFPNIALAFEPGEKDVMKRSPRKKFTPLLDNKNKIIILLVSLISGVGAIILFNFMFNLTGNFTHASTLVFTLLAVDSLFYIFSVRFLNSSMFSRKIFSNLYLWLAVGLAFSCQLLVVYHPFLQNIFRTTALSLNDWLIILVISLLNVLVVEVIKMCFMLYNKYKIT